MTFKSIVRAKLVLSEHNREFLGTEAKMGRDLVMGLVAVQKLT